MLPPQSPQILRLIRRCATVRRCCLHSLIFLAYCLRQGRFRGSMRRFPSSLQETSNPSTKCLWLSPPAIGQGRIVRSRGGKMPLFVRSVKPSAMSGVMSGQLESPRDGPDIITYRAIMTTAGGLPMMIASSWSSTCQSVCQPPKRHPWKAGEGVYMSSMRGVPSAWRTPDSRSSPFRNRHRVY